MKRWGNHGWVNVGHAWGRQSMWSRNELRLRTKTAIKRIFGAKDSAACLLSLKSFEVFGKSIKIFLLMSTIFMARKQIQWSTSSTDNKTVDVQILSKLLPLLSEQAMEIKRQKWWKDGIYEICNIDESFPGAHKTPLGKNVKTLRNWQSQNALQWPSTKFQHCGHMKYSWKMSPERYTSMKLKFRFGLVHKHCIGSGCF